MDQNFKYFKFEVAPTIPGQCDKNGPVGEHVGFRSSRAHYVDSWCWGTTLSSFCHILCAILSWDTNTCWHRQRPSDRMHLGEESASEA